MNHVGIQCQFCILLCFIVVDVIVALETSLLLSKMAMLIYIPTNSGPEFHFLHILTNICWRFFFVFCFLISIQTYWNEVISPWALIYISLRISEIELFVLGTYWPLYFPLEKKSPFKATTAHFLIRFFFLLLRSYTEYKVNVQKLAPLLYVNSALSETKRNQESNVISKNYKK